MSTSCGCFQKERASKVSTDDLTGREFAHLKVMYRNGSYRPKNYGIGRKKVAYVPYGIVNVIAATNVMLLVNF